MLTDTKKTKNVVTDNDVIDLEIGAVKKKRFRVDGDNDRILELNVSDAGIVGRLREFYPRIRKLGDKLASQLAKKAETTDEEELTQLSKIIKELDTEIKKMLDDLFDAPVSEICLPFGTAVDPTNGEYAFEIVLNKLGKLYENNFAGEVSAIRKNISKHTAKYTKSRKR